MDVDGDGLDGGEDQRNNLLEFIFRAHFQDFLGEIVTELIDHERLENCNKLLDECGVEFGVLGLIESLLEHPAAGLVISVEIKLL